MASRRLTVGTLVPLLVPAAPALALTTPLLTNGSFEVGQPSDDLPQLAGVWGIDGATFVGPTAGITPLDGAQMLQIDSTIPACNPQGNGLGGDIGQLIDAAPVAGLIASGNAVITASCSFNRVDAPLADTEFRITVRCWDKPAQDVFDDCTPDGWILLDSEVLISDGDPETWEQITIEVPVPVETQTIEMVLSIFENVANQAPPNEFEGHFADHATLCVGPACPEDLNGDGSIGSQDLNILLGNFGCIGGGCAGDIDGDGDADSSDLNLLLAAFGERC